MDFGERSVEAARIRISAKINEDYTGRRIFRSILHPGWSQKRNGVLLFQRVFAKSFLQFAVYNERFSYQRAGGVARKRLYRPVLPRYFIGGHRLTSVPGTSQPTTRK